LLSPNSPAIASLKMSLQATTGRSPPCSPFDLLSPWSANGGESGPPSPRSQKLVESVRVHTARCWAKLTGQDKANDRASPNPSEPNSPIGSPAPTPRKGSPQHKGHKRSVSFSNKSVLILVDDVDGKEYPATWDDSDDDTDEQDQLLSPKTAPKKIEFEGR